MTRIGQIVGLAAAVSLSACGVIDVPTRGFGLVPKSTEEGAEPSAPDLAVAEVRRPAYTVRDIVVRVPETLRVSEANVYYPLADIVWRDDNYGNRHDQVRALAENAFALGTAGFTSGPEVDVDVEFRRFHALTEKARFTVGGVHSIRFLLTVRDAASGILLDGPRLVAADLKASGGTRAIAEDARGYTQTVAITQHLAGVIARELSLPVADESLVARATATGPSEAAPGLPSLSDAAPHDFRTVGVILQ